MSTLSTIKDVTEETTRKFEIEGVKFVATKDQMYSMWRLTANGKPMTSAYTTWPKAYDAADLYVRQRSEPVAPTKLKKDLTPPPSKPVKKEAVDG